MALILVAEDDRAIARGLTENLRFEGYDVSVVGRGDEVLSSIASERPAVLILDVMLPGLSGFEVCRRLRRTDKQLPVMLLTARGEDVDKVMGLDLGADDYLTKPFSLPEFLARVRALVRRGEAASVPVPSLDYLQFGDAVIDFAQYVATKHGVDVHLTAREFALLRCLASENGAAVRRDVLLQRVWGEDTSVTNRTVDTHVLSLRQKLEVEPARPRHLLTVHGVGYRFTRIRQSPDMSRTDT